MSGIANARNAGIEASSEPESLRAARTARWFWITWSFIGLVSVFDAWLVVYHLPEILGVEENPICRFLIELDTERLSVFLPAKALGTVLVLVILRAIFIWRREYSLPIMGGVAAYQAGLVLYLVAW